jgi:uncharacterized protein (TIGR02145 family)
MNTRLLFYFLAILLIASCEIENTPPVAKVYALPAIGDTTTVFMLEGKNSSDAESSYFALRYRWDTDADGSWDAGYSTATSFTARFSKEGYQKFILEVTDSDGAATSVTDSVFVLSRNTELDTLTDPRDGQRYRIVKIGERWWMSDNLRYGVPIDVKTAFRDNGRIEFLYYNNSKDLDHYGSLYTWLEAHEYPTHTVFRDICPPGWRIPTSDQWADLIKKYPQPFDILYYLGPSSIVGLGVTMTGYYRYGDPLDPMKGEYKADRYGVRYWTSGFTGQDTTRFFTGINFSRDSSYFVRSYHHPSWIYHPMFPGYIIGHNTVEAYYVRCVR